MENSNLVWYACYGSNILRERFLCYVKGCECRHNGRSYKGCTDKTEPTSERPITIQHKLYFGRKSSSWSNGGVAFLNPVQDKDVKTLGKMYLITKEQFSEIQEQEGIDKSWYGYILKLGELDGIDILTFTSVIVHDLNAPSKEYLQVISEGLMETYLDLNQGVIDKYLGYIPKSTHEIL